ncbi:hypothetical protein BPAE_0003g00810 [Botrytis paeoniae]|uniref:Uncharacterized protein n=1 Tax=Botrytis paeoniae TaxID=278948 RepID=A0A4Z1G1A9_9HELO|nr:hypothetical protein BPAE_0003g00810 [Botrytis paeoniae]
MPHVDIDDVIQALQENHQDTPSDENTRDDLGDPGDVGVGGPGKPEESDGEDEGTEDHGGETFFGDHSAVFFELAREARFGDPGDGAGAEEDADEDADEGEGAEARGPAARLLEGDGVGFEEEVEDAVDEGHVEGDEEENWFLEEHDEGAEEIGL